MEILFYLRGCPEVAVRALVAGRAVLLDDVGGQLGRSRGDAAAVAALEPPEPVDQLLWGRIQQNFWIVILLLSLVLVSWICYFLKRTCV